MKEKEVSWSLLVFGDFIVQFIGSREAAQVLVKCVEFDKVDLQAPPDCEYIVWKKFKPRIRQNMVLMRLNREEEHFKQLTLLSGLAVKMQRKLLPCWDDATQNIGVKQRRNILGKGGKHVLAGNYTEKKLVSIGSARFDVDFATNIGVIATDENYRDSG